MSGRKMSRSGPTRDILRFDILLFDILPDTPLKQPLAGRGSMCFRWAHAGISRHSEMQIVLYF